jgi:hypothetical protein
MDEKIKTELPERITRALAKEDILQAQLSQLLSRVTEGFQKVDTLVIDVTRLTANVELVSSDLGIVKDRVAILESRRNDDDARANRNSARVRQVSESDLEQQAQLAQEKAAREALASEVSGLKETNAKQLVILDRLEGFATKFAASPVVRRIGYAAGVLILSLLTAATGYLARGNSPPQQIQPTIIQVPR